MKQVMPKPFSPNSYLFFSSISTFKTKNLYWNLIHLNLNPSFYSDKNYILFHHFIISPHMVLIRKTQKTVSIRRSSMKQSRTKYHTSNFELSIWSIKLSTYFCIYHHHLVVPLVRISLTLSRHFSQSFIASGRSSGLHPVSSHSCWMYFGAGRPAFARRGDP